MEYQIEFCVSCYLPKALDLANAIMENHAHDDGFTLRLLAGAPGKFDVIRDGKKVYSRSETNRLPQPGEIETGLRTRLGLEASTSDKPCC